MNRIDIIKHENGYHINYRGFSYIKSLSRALNISPKLLDDICLRNHGKKINSSYDKMRHYYLFQYISDIKNVISELLPYTLMNRLGGEI